MGTRETNRDTQKVGNKPPRCSLCKQTYTPMCDYMQGRCPHHPAIINIALSKEVRTRFQNIFKFFKKELK